jgi:hypothetical protein
MIEEIHAKIQAGQFEFSKHAPARPLIKIIIVYEPDPAEWTDFRIRRT